MSRRQFSRIAIIPMRCEASTKWITRSSTSRTHGGTSKRFESGGHLGPTFDYIPMYGIDAASAAAGGRRR